MNPTIEQKTIIDCQDNLVVIACPGSGKTFTLSSKIKLEVDKLSLHKGVIALSFTKKASRELKQRCTHNGIDIKCSFFGTIDSFCLSEIILPFLPHVLDVKKLDQPNIMISSDKVDSTDPLIRAKKLWDSNIVEIRNSARLATIILKKSIACQRYLKARYTWFFIDEYQDCDSYQHALFQKIVGLGVKGGAVGDVNQSIFKFRGTNPKYLHDLANSQNYKLFHLQENHRCHKSIAHYSSRLLDPNHHIPDELECRVFRLCVKKDESSLANWIGDNICEIMKALNVTEMNKVALLVKNNRTGDVVHHSFPLKHKYSIETDLDNDGSKWGMLFRRLLFWIFDQSESRMEIAEEYITPQQSTNNWRIMRKLLLILVEASKKEELHSELSTFLKISRLVFPSQSNSAAVRALKTVLNDTKAIKSFCPAMSDEIELMTLHKSKGLEFELVFHLDMYEYILPQYKETGNQSLNLHYVGLTRAKKAVVLCTSTWRTKSDGKKDKNAKPSPFYHLNDLFSYSRKIREIMNSENP